jgi:hypothetical protein
MKQGSLIAIVSPDGGAFRPEGFGDCIADAVRCADDGDFLVHEVELHPADATSWRSQ